MIPAAATVKAISRAHAGDTELKVPRAVDLVAVTYANGGEARCFGSATRAVCLRGSVRRSGSFSAIRFVVASDDDLALPAASDLDFIILSAFGSQSNDGVTSSATMRSGLLRRFLRVTQV